MMGRITFLHFLQRKGWMNKDLNYMQNLFKGSEQQDNYLDAVLEPLFFGVLNTKREDREAVFRKEHWNVDLLKKWQEIPYLNGGLFERDNDDECTCQFPREYFERLFEFFSEYNFTIDENEPDDVEVGVDPEMLGKIFENLLEDNKDKGAFYTPKEIVRYMCQESLSAYLCAACLKCGTREDDVRGFVADPDKKIAKFSEEEKDELKKALEVVRICDPAIGSGAFPMGLLGELVRCRKALSPTEKRSELKKAIIENNIYGVDIEKGAVDIARLRFWLSIIVDEEGDQPSPLPNLDYKIMQGDSLRESFEGYDLSKLGAEKVVKEKQQSFDFANEEQQQELDFDPGSRRKIQDLVEEYYNENDHQKKTKLREEISSTVGEYVISGGANLPIIQEKLTSLKIPNSDFFLWHTFFVKVFERDNPGFDIIIGNPPYIQLSKGKLGKLYEKCNYRTFTPTGDIYCLFYEQGWNLLREKGHLCYITSNKWMRADYGKSLRRFLGTKTAPLVLVDCSGYQVFKDATVDTNILLFSKESNTRQSKGLIIPKGGVENMSDYVQQNSVICSFEPNSPWLILSPIEQNIKRKIEAAGKPLKEWDVRINYGIKTGFNEAFIISTEQREKILSNCNSDAERKRTEELIRPILRGRDIKRYGYTWADLWLIATFPSRHYNIENYPAVKEYLLSFGKERLEQTGKKYAINGGGS